MRTAWALRIVVAVCVIVSGVVHFQLWRDGMRFVDVVGPAFLVNAVAGIVIGVLLFVWRHWLPLLLAVGFGAATLGAFIVATTPLGLFGVHSRWEGTEEWVSAVTEALAVVLGVTALLRERRPVPQPAV
jgi:uncharacterized membrane protein YphA (DoxX/SURF4 family)